MTTISPTDIVKFDRSENFGLWQRVKAMLVQQGLMKALSGKQSE